MQFKLPRFLRKNITAGYSLIEANVSMAMAGSFISAVLMVNGSLLGLLKTTKESATATQAVQERVEQMRIANWVQITDAGYISRNLLNADTASSATLASTVETMTIATYPASSAGVAQVKRQGGAVQVISSSAALKDARLVQVTVDLSWRGGDKRSHSRATTTLIAKGGVVK